MEKTATLNLRVNPVSKANAEAVLSRLGVPMSTAVDMYLRQIALTGGIPFSVSLPQAPSCVNADEMTDEQLLARFREGLDDARNGHVRSASEAFADFRRDRRG